MSQPPEKRGRGRPKGDKPKGIKKKKINKRATEWIPEDSF